MSDTPELIKGVLVNGQIHKIDYNALANKPNIEALEEEIEKKQDALEFDNMPTDGSDNPVKSKGIKVATDELKNDITSAFNNVFNELYIDTREQAQSGIIWDDDNWTLTLSFPHALVIGSNTCSYNIGTNKNLVGLFAPHCRIIHESAISNNYSLSTVYLPECEYIGASAFFYDETLPEINLPMCKYIGRRAFGQCYSLSSINIPECSYIGDRAFDGCRELSSITIDPNRLTYLGEGAFFECTKFSDINRFLSCFSIIPDECFAGTGASSIYGSNHTEIPFDCFAGCNLLTDISFPMCEKINSYAFQRCNNLSYVEFPKCSVIYGSAFYCCSNLETINFPECKSIMYGTFEGCSNLKSVNLPKCSYISSKAFRSCTALTSISFTEKINISSEAFQDCSALSYVYLNNGGTIGYYAFYKCVNLVSIYLMGSSIINGGFTAFYSTPIFGYSDVAGRYGSIYVPSSLYSDYITHSYWASYSSRFVSI
jgi:hypothetical protein